MSSKKTAIRSTTAQSSLFDASAPEPEAAPPPHRA